MIHHLVIWRLKKTADGEQLCRELEGLRDRIPGLLDLKTGLDFSRGPNSGDLALATTFASREDLAVYQSHPAHLAVVNILGEQVDERRVADFETD